MRVEVGTWLRGQNKTMVEHSIKLGWWWSWAVGKAGNHGRGQVTQSIPFQGNYSTALHPVLSLLVRMVRCVGDVYSVAQLQCPPDTLRLHVYYRLNYLLYLYDFGPEKDPLDVLLFWLVLFVVAFPIGDGLQPPQQGLHEVHQVFPPLKSRSKRDVALVCLII